MTAISAGLLVAPDTIELPEIAWAIAGYSTINLRIVVIKYQ